MSTSLSFDAHRIRRGLFAVRRRADALRLNTSGWVADHTARPRTFVRPVTQVVSPAAWNLAVVGLASMWGSFRWDWTELRVAAWFILFVLVVSIIFVFGRHQLRATLDLSRDRVVVGERANGRLLLTNETRHRTLPLTIELPVGQGRADFELPSLGTGAEHEDLFAIPTSRRGVLTVGPVHAVRSDPLGLLRRDQSLTEPELLFVHPRTVRVQSSAAGMIRDLEGQETRKLTDSDVSFHALRGYVPGDDRRFIHWKTSARTGTLMVRQFEETRRSHLLVALSTRVDDYASDDEFETALSIAGSLGLQSINERQTLSMSTSTRHLTTPSAKRLLDQLSGVEFERNAPRLPEVARRLARDINGASVAILVCGSMVEAAEMRKAGRFFALDVRTIVVRNQPDQETAIRSMGGIDIVSIGDLKDLPSAIRRLSR
jgi:uncharacterized protein (DUF58 family)